MKYIPNLDVAALAFKLAGHVPILSSSLGAASAYAPFERGSACLTSLHFSVSSLLSCLS